MSNRGKEFEDLFKTLAEKAGVSVVRFYDTFYKGKKGVRNPCDFVISKGPDEPAILIECKETIKPSFSFSAFPQFDDLVGLTNFKSYLVVWYSNYKRIVAFDVQELNQYRKSGAKSINPNKIANIRYIRPIELATVYKVIKPESLEVKKLWER